MIGIGRQVSHSYWSHLFLPLRVHTTRSAQAPVHPISCVFSQCPPLQVNTVSWTNPVQAPFLFLFYSTLLDPIGETQPVTLQEPTALSQAFQEWIQIGLWPCLVDIPNSDHVSTSRGLPVVHMNVLITRYILVVWNLVAIGYRITTYYYNCHMICIIWDVVVKWCRLVMWYHGDTHGDTHPQIHTPEDGNSRCQNPKAWNLSDLTSVNLRSCSSQDYRFPTIRILKSSPKL